MCAPPLFRIWLILAACFGIAFALVTPPMQAPDEVGHFWRAVAIARGDWAPSKVNGLLTSRAPKGVRDLVGTVWVFTAGQPEVKIGIERIRAAARVPMQRDVLVNIRYPAYYTPVAQLHTAAVWIVAMAFDVRPLFAFYTGRLCNVALLVLLMSISMRRLDDHASVAGVTLLPMTLYLAGSYSTDAITIGLAALVTALALTPDETDERYPHKLAIATLLLCLTKPAYIFLPLIALRTVRRDRRARSTSLVVVLAVIAGTSLSAFNAARNYSVGRAGVGIDASAQLHSVLHHPLRFLGVLAGDAHAHALDYVDQLIGRLGWIDVGLPGTFLCAILLLCVGLTTRPLSGVVDRAIAGMLIVGCAFLVVLSQYLTWTPAGAGFIEGVQGRYFLPLVPLTLSCIGVPGGPDRIRQGALWLFTIAMVALNLAALVIVARRYY